MLFICSARSNRNRSFEFQDHFICGVLRHRVASQMRQSRKAFVTAAEVPTCRDVSGPLSIVANSKRYVKWHYIPIPLDIVFSTPEKWFWLKLTNLRNGHVVRKSTGPKKRLSPTSTIYNDVNGKFFWAFVTSKLMSVDRKSKLPSKRFSDNFNACICHIWLIVDGRYVSL